MKKILIALLASFAMVGCYENKGNYDYTLANTLDIDALLENEYFPSAELNVEYVHELEISDSLLNLFDFQWESYYQDSLYVYNTDATLRFTPTSTQTVSVRLTATDKTSGVVSYQESGINISVNDPNSGNSWMILGEVDGTFGLSLIIPESDYLDEDGDGTYTLTRTGYDITYNLNTSIPSDAYEFCIGYDNAYYDYDVYKYITDFSFFVKGKTDTYILSQSSPFDVYTTLSENILDCPADFEYQSYYHSANDGFVVSKDGTFFKKSREAGMLYNYESPYVEYPYTYNDEEVKVLDVLDEYSERTNWYYDRCGVIMQDQSGKKFIAHIDYDDNYSVEYYTAAHTYNYDTETSVDLDDIGDWEIVWKSSFFTFPQQYQMLFEKDGEYRMLYIARNDNTNLTVSSQDFPAELSALINNDTRYYLQQTGYLFMSSGNTVYKYIFTTNVYEEFYSVPVGETITAISANLQERELIVGTDKGTVLILDATRDLVTVTGSEKLLYTIEGFSSITDIEYKYESYSKANCSGYDTAYTSYWD